MVNDIVKFIEVATGLASFKSALTGMVRREYSEAPTEAVPPPTTEESRN